MTFASRTVALQAFACSDTSLRDLRLAGELDKAAAAPAARGRLSFQDRLCLAIARAEGRTCR